MKKVCVICDREKEYAVGFMEYINRRKTLPLEAAACTSKESLLACAQKEPAEILLVAENLMDEEIGAIPAVATIVLDEGGSAERFPGYRRVYKYQACDALLREVMEVYSMTEHAVLEFGEGRRRGRKVYGVYSPVDDGNRTAFALALGQLLAEKQRVLYAELSQFSALDTILQMQPERSLADLVFYQGQEHADLPAKLSGMVYERFGMDLIPPLSSPEDLFGIHPPEWIGLFGELMEKGPYEVLVLDLGIPSFALLDYCTSVFVPVGSGEWSGLRTERFLSALEGSRYRETKEKVIPVRLSVPGCPAPRELADSPADSPLGPEVRQAVRNLERRAEDKREFGEAL